MHPVLLSICIPTYNNACWLEYTLENALDQASDCSYGVQVVVSDNASTDNTAEVLNKYKKKYGELLIYARNEKNIGHNANYLKCTQLALGQKVWLLGTDDILLPSCVQKILKIIQKYPKINYIYVPYITFTPGLTPAQTTLLQEKLVCENFNTEISEGIIPNLRALATLNCNSFTPIYCSIVNKTHWVSAFEVGIQGPFFSSLDTVVPEATYIIKHMLDLPGYYIETPYVLASTTLSWNEYACTYVLYWLFELYDLLESRGISKKKINVMRKKNLLKNGPALLHFLTYPKTAKRFNFSFFNYAMRHLYYKEFWIVLLQIANPWLKYFFSKHFWVPKLYPDFDKNNAI